MTFAEDKATAALVTKGGDVFLCKGFGAEGETSGEIVFNTAMSGYQESLTDPSYLNQIMVFTFPHIGNAGVNSADNQSYGIRAAGLIVRNYPTPPSNWRAEEDFITWIKKQGITGLCEIDTRALVKKIRASKGGLYGIIAYNENGLDIEDLKRKATAIQPAEGEDMAKEATFKTIRAAGVGSLRVAVMDYGVKQEIIDDIVDVGCDVKVFPAETSFDEVMQFSPDGVFLSNGPGDPEATGEYAIPFIKRVLEKKIPVFGICLGHQMLALALGAKTVKMPKGHRGENHPVQDLRTGKVFITSQNHGFCVDKDSLPDDIQVTHKSLFDDSIEGIRSTKYPAFSVQYHPEASPGPNDCKQHFKEFAELMKNAKKN